MTIKHPAITVTQKDIELLNYFQAKGLDGSSSPMATTDDIS